jgi:carbon storage regulator
MRGHVSLSVGLDAFWSNGSAMLVLSRKVGEKIHIGDNIVVMVVRLTNGGVRLGIEAPPEMVVVRDEVKRSAAEAAESPKLATASTHQ